jgi:Peptidase family M50
MVSEQPILRKFSKMRKLFGNMLGSNYEKYILLNGVTGLLLVLILPSHSIGWICLNIVVFQLIYTMMIFFHELGHAIASVGVGMKVIEIAVGFKKIIFEFKFFGVSWKIKQNLSAG